MRTTLHNACTVIFMSASEVSPSKSSSPEIAPNILPPTEGATLSPFRSLRWIMVVGYFAKYWRRRIALWNSSLRSWGSFSVRIWLLLKQCKNNALLPRVFTFLTSLPFSIENVAFLHCVLHHSYAVFRVGFVDHYYPLETSSYLILNIESLSIKHGMSGFHFDVRRHIVYGISASTNSSSSSCLRRVRSYSTSSYWTGGRGIVGSGELAAAGDGCSCDDGLANCNSVSTSGSWLKIISRCSLVIRPKSQALCAQQCISFTTINL